MFKREDAFALCMDFYEKYNREQVDSKAFCIDYETLMSKILKKELKIKNKNARREIIETLGYGNWEHLWETDEEEKKSAEEIIQNIIGDIFYCSDRWSWDRFLRINWLYLCYRQKKRTETI